MKGKMYLSFRAKNSTNPKRVYHAIFPVDICSSDGIIDDELVLDAVTVDGMMIDLTDNGICDASLKLE